MKKTMITIMTTIFMATAISFLFSTKAMAASIEDDPIWIAYKAEMEQNSQIARQNKANYDKTATKLQKKVDDLIDKASSEEAKTASAAVAELIDLKSKTKDWSSNIAVPLTLELPPRAILIKVGYRFDDASIASGDLRYFVWAIEDGEIVGVNLESFPEVVSDGGFHESVNKYLNHPTSGVVRNENGHEWYWWTID